MDKPLSLDEIRREIDRIDDAVLRLLGERMAAVEVVRAAKAAMPSPPGTALRPGREAEILRRLIAARAPGVPADLVLRVWREVMSTATQTQAAMRVKVVDRGTDPTLRDMAVAQFGTATPIESFDSADEVVAAIAGEVADIGVVPGLNASQSWPKVLLALGESRPMVIGRLPFVRQGDGAGAAQGADGYVIGYAPIEATGEDSTLVAVSGGPAVGGSAALAMLVSAGASGERLGDSGGWAIWRIDGLIGEADARLTALQRALGARELAVLGAFANPVVLEDAP